MDFVTTLQIAVAIGMALCGIILQNIHNEIKSIRERLHKLEGATATANAHLELFNNWISEGQQLSNRMTRLETVLENVAPIKRTN